MTRVQKQNFVITTLAILIFILLFIYLNPAKPSKSFFYEKTSTFYTDESGTRAIFLVLKAFLPSVKRWMKSLEVLPPPEMYNPSSLLIMGPSLGIKAAEADSLDNWVRRGGQLIIASQDSWSCMPGEDSVEEETTSAEGSFRPVGYLCRHGFSFIAREEELEEYSDATGKLLLKGNALHKGDFKALFNGKAGIKGGEKCLGLGRIIVITDKLVWSNQRLSQSRNGAWLVSTVLSWGNGRLLIDEFHHGFQKTRGAFSLMLHFFTSYWGFAFLQLAAAGLLLIFIRAKRFGNVVELLQESRRNPLGQIESLGALLEAARAKNFAVRTIHQLLLKRLWQSRYGAIQAKGQSSIEKAVLNLRSSATDISHYLSLVQRIEKGGSLKEEEFIQAACWSGKIAKEYRYARKRFN